MRALLEDGGVLKVTYDCRALSDCLWHRHIVQLEGVWDLLVGDTVFMTSSPQAVLLPRYTRSLAHLLKDYLGLPDTFLPFPRTVLLDLDNHCFWAILRAKNNKESCQT